MEKFNLYIHERIDVGNNTVLETKLKIDKAYIAEVLERDSKEPNISKEIGFLVAYFDEHPTMEDARPYWVMQYIVSPEHKEGAGEVMENILDTLLSKKVIEKPALIHNIDEAMFKDGDVIRIQRGKIFPDDLDDK